MFTIEREPTPPGEILAEEFLKPMNLTQKQLADHLGCDVKVINRIVNNRTSITAEMAVKLGFALGTSPEFWLNAQQAADIYRAKMIVQEVPDPLIQVG
ncbi:MAG TPA: addiction module antidote protein, HigA family [bacterium]|nr:addiction module antidote protein, HigA family [bacterium]